MTKIVNFIKKFWLILFLISSFVFILHYLFEQANHISKPLYFAWEFLLITIFFHILYWIVAAFTWKYLVQVTCQTIISPFQSFSQLIFVIIGKYIPGKIWGMMARGTQLKLQGIDTQTIFFITLQEQFLLLQASAIVSAIFLGILMNTMWAWGLMGIALLSILIGRSLQTTLIRLYSYLMNLFGLNKNQPVKIKETITQHQHYYLSFLSAYIAIWILAGCIFSGLYFTFMTQNAFSLQIIAWMILANTIGITVGFFALFAPGGIGVRESVSSLVLSQVIPLEQAIFLSLLYRFWTVLTELTFGLIVGYILGKNIFKKTPIKPH